MKRARIETELPLPLLPSLPGWLKSGAAETLETAAFQCGAALAHLTVVTKTAALPQQLWRDRLALEAALVCIGFAGRRESAVALRDALHLTRPGDHLGPAGQVLWQWSQAVARPVSVAGLAKVLDGVAVERIACCLDAVGTTPVDRAAGAIEAVLTESPRAETAALILADAVLSKALGQDHIVPLLSLALKTRDMARSGDDLRLACYRSVMAGTRQAIPLAADLARRAARLQAVIPKLRAKGAARAVDLFLSRDALTPGALTFMSDRAARRLCERLVDLSVLRELTGRDTFRLYGV
ncbi:MAG: DUF1403 family protein [Paracoccaceae bacterium]